SQIQYTNDHKPKEWLAYLKQAIKEDYASYYDNLEKEKEEKEARKKEFERRLRQLEKEKENEEKRIAEERKKERIKNLEDEIDKLTYQRDLEIEKTAKSIFESLPESVKEQIIKLSKATILEENPNENVNSTDHIFTVKLNIYTLDTVKSLYPDKFKEIHDKFDKQIDNLREEIKSI
ncbi:MAG: hypothetical protein ACP5GQ_08665, partial [Athalassotoga sp.]